MTTQDFSNKIVLVIRKDIGGWQCANTIAHIAAYVGNKLRDSFSTGDVFVTKDAMKYPRNSQYPIIIKRAGSSEQLKNFLEKVRASNLLYHAFIREMLDYTDDVELQNAINIKSDEHVELLGVGIFGPNVKIAALSKKFGLWE
ncbi:MAG: DUF2000 family protein [Minisyncoccia bacterium]